MKTSQQQKYSDLLVRHILGGSAYIKIEKILEGVSFDQVGIKYDGLPYSFWQLLEHLRIAQKDILDFSISADYKELNWPQDYWPLDAAPESPEHWEKTKTDFFRDRKAFNALLQSNAESLLEPFAHGSGQTLFREALLILEHNAYHTGQLMLISRLMIGKKI